MSEATPAAEKPQRPFLASPSFWGGLLAMGAMTALAYFVVQKEQPLPELTDVPRFELTDQSGGAYGTGQLAGQVWIANYVFTRCPTVCPPFTAKMASVHRDLSDTPVRFVSISVDPEHDTPEKLKAYGEKYQADFTRWTFLTGPREAITDLSVKGMFQPLVRGDPDNLASVVHGSNFVLIDQRMKVRGFYRYTAPEELAAMKRDAKRLLAE